MSIGLFRKKERLGWWHTYISEKTLGIYIFVTLPLENKLCATTLRNSTPKENPNEFFLITLKNHFFFYLFCKYCMLYLAWNSMFSTPPISFFSGIGWSLKICLVSIILKEFMGGWIRKYQVYLFFMLRQLKTTDSLRNSDKVT